MFTTKQARGVTVMFRKCLITVSHVGRFPPLTDVVGFHYYWRYVKSFPHQTIAV